MVVDESSRNAMFNRLQEVLGKETAAVLMQHLPPFGWADVATKRDLEALRTEFRADLANALHSQTRVFVTWLLASTSAATITVGALAFAAARLI